MKITIICSVVIFALVCNLTVASAFSDTSSIDKFDSDVSDLELVDFQRNFDYKNSRLRRSFYYDDYYNYYPYPYAYPSYSKPLETVDPDIDRAYKYTPIVRYKSTRTKRKKLFVPNLWG